jgi:hypothetical protein
VGDPVKTGEREKTVKISGAHILFADGSRTGLYNPLTIGISPPFAPTQTAVILVKVDVGIS